MNMLLMIIVNTLFIFLSFYIIYSIFSVTKTFIIASDNGYDELEKKALIEALAISMLVLMIIHIIQLLLSLKFKNLYPNDLYIAVISSGAPKGVLLGNSPLHIESIFFDTFLIALIYNINKLRYGLIDREQFLRPLIVILTILIFIVIILLGQIN